MAGRIDLKFSGNIVGVTGFPAVGLLKMCMIHFNKSYKVLDKILCGTEMIARLLGSMFQMCDYKMLTLACVLIAMMFSASMATSVKKCKYTLRRNWLTGPYM